MPVERVTGARLPRKRDARSARAIVRHYFYGGMPDAMDKIVRRATAMLGRQAIAGWHCPPFRQAGAAEDPAVLAEIAAAKPDVIWVGLGLPKQEYWMANHQMYFPGTLMLGVGAAFRLLRRERSAGAGRAPAASAWNGFTAWRSTRSGCGRVTDVVPKALTFFRRGVARLRRTLFCHAPLRLEVTGAASAHSAQAGSMIGSPLSAGTSGPNDASAGFSHGRLAFLPIVSCKVLRLDRTVALTSAARDGHRTAAAEPRDVNRGPGEGTHVLPDRHVQAADLLPNA